MPAATAIGCNPTGPTTSITLHVALHLQRGAGPMALMLWLDWVT
jgi:hypothetical protein